MDSDDEFLDDGLDFDAIPAGTLLQLEQSAWQATQPAPQYDESAILQTNRNQLNHNSQYNAPPQRRQSGFYGDVEVIDLGADILDNDEPLEDVVTSNPPVAQYVLHGSVSTQRQYTPVQTQHVEPVQNADIHYPDREIGARIEEVMNSKLSD
jgi:hypothetical protein